MKDQSNVFTLLGSAGGVAKSILSILNSAACDIQDPLYHFLQNSTFYLIDNKQKPRDYYNKLFPNIFKKMVVLEFDVGNISLLSKHLLSTKTKIVVDVSWGDTVDIIKCCNQYGILYVNTALENTMIDENEDEYKGFPLMERIRIFEQVKDLFTKTTGIVGSGMNPGVVQWMALELIKKHKDKKPLACYIVEHDTSFLKDEKLAKKNAIYTTWSPECFLDEAILSYPMLVQNHTPLYLYEEVYAQEFKVKLDNQEFYGCLMPHEEVYTLGKTFDMESGFLYKVNDHTTSIIRENLANTDVIWDFELNVLDPSVHELIGEDLVGVLLVFEDSEAYMYNVLSNKEIYETFQTNATYYQVASGVYAGIATLLLDELPKGIFYVDELLLKTDSKYGSYLQAYMKEFIVGENPQSDGMLLKRMRKIKE